MKSWNETRGSRPGRAGRQGGEPHALVPVHCLNCGMPQFPKRSIETANTS